MTDESQSTGRSEKAKRTKQEPLRIFEVWKEYEHIAMHFNELLMQLRMRALGGIAVVSALVGLLSKTDTAADFRWGLVASVLSILSFVWAAIWVIDMMYYRRLLLGSVRAVLEIEATSAGSAMIDSLQMSHRIKETVEGNFNNLNKNPFWKDAVFLFYFLVVIALLLGLYISLVQHCTATDKSVAHSYGVCAVVTYPTTSDKQVERSSLEVQ